jgi:formylglycine-generating enzyme required for sulfatase activity
MGDPTLGNTYGTTSSERLVVVSPFFLDASEATVGRFRASGVAVQGRVLTHETEASCTFTTASGGGESMPLNCVTRPAALAYCATKGARLPTEAEWEYVAGGRRSAYAVWGDDPAECGDAVFARTPGAAPDSATGACLSKGAGPAPAGSGALDRLGLATGTIVDVTGNLTEWIADAWALEGSPCWRGAFAIDPTCTASSPGATRDYTVRGGSFAQPASQLRAAIRASVSSQGDPFSTTIGFRCARPGL